MFAPEAVKVELPPVQTETGEAEAETVGKVLTVTVTVAVAVQPAVVPVTVKVVVEKGEMVTDELVEPPGNQL